SLLLHSFSFFFFFTVTPPPDLYTLSLHDALPICIRQAHFAAVSGAAQVAHGLHFWFLFSAPGKNPANSLFTSVHYTCFFRRIQRSEEHTSELQSRFDLVCRLLLEKKNMSLICSIQ